GRARARVGVRVRVRERCREPPARLHRTGGGGGFLPFPFPKEVNGRERERERERSVERSRPQFSRSCPAPVRALSTKGAARTSRASHSSALPAWRSGPARASPPYSEQNERRWAASRSLGRVVVLTSMGRRPPCLDHEVHP